MAHFSKKRDLKGSQIACFLKKRDRKGRYHLEVFYLKAALLSTKPTYRLFYLATALEGPLILFFSVISIIV